MYIYVDFYKQFNCIGSDCLNTCCCVQWGISFDQDTVNYYAQLEGEFGDFIRQNLVWSEKDNRTLVKMTDDGYCPFLNEKGLCRIYIEYGEYHTSYVCRRFPRTNFDLNGNSMRGFSLSCEEVLRMLYDKPDPLHLCVEGNTNITTMDDLAIYELSQFIGWGMEILQDESIPLGIALQTVLHVGLEADTYFKENDYESFETIILNASDIQEQFVLKKENVTSEMIESAWDLIFGVTDTFCLILREADAFKWDTFLWGNDIFNKSDSERRNFVIDSWNNRTHTTKHKTFLRKLAASFFQTHSMMLGTESGTSIYIRDLCNYLILATILPLTWSSQPHDNKHAYLSRLSHISHYFEQSHVVKDFVWPVIQDLFHADLYTYTIALMVLFGE